MPISIEIVVQFNIRASWTRDFLIRQLFRLHSMCTMMSSKWFRRHVGNNYCKNKDITLIEVMSQHRNAWHASLQSIHAGADCTDTLRMPCPLHFKATTDPLFTSWFQSEHMRRISQSHMACPKNMFGFVISSHQASVICCCCSSSSSCTWSLRSFTSALSHWRYMYHLVRVFFSLTGSLESVGIALHEALESKTKWNDLISFCFAEFRTLI